MILNKVVLYKIMYIKRRIYQTVNLFLVITFIFFSNSSLSEEQSSNTAEKQTIKNIQHLKNKIKNSKEDFAIQDKEREALKARLQEMEKQIDQLLKQNNEKDAKIKELQKQAPD